jgi:hypothetical protein
MRHNTDKIFGWGMPEGVELEQNDVTGGLIVRGAPIKREGKEEFTTDDPSKIGTGAIKYDGGKPALWRGVFDYFPRAIQAIGDISTFGARKYAWAGWESVEDGFARYSDAMVRHLTKEGAGELYDPDSGLLHAAHTAWGAMARLELLMREMEQKDGE